MPKSPTPHRQESQPDTPSGKEALRPSTKVSPTKNLEQSITEVFLTEESPLLYYAHSLVARREVAEDIVQDAFIKLHQNWHEVHAPRAWLYRATRNLCLNHIRKNKREILIEHSDDIQFERQNLTGLSPDTKLEHAETIETLRILIAKLPAEGKKIVELKYIENQSYSDIGKTLNLKTGNVGYKIHHLLKHLSTSLRQVGITSPRG